VLFFNNKARKPNLNGIDDYLEDMWEIKDQIAWDREASRKKIINWVEQKPDTNDKSKKIEEFKGDYIFYIANPDITNEIKKHEVFQTQNTKEREQLHADYEKLFSEIRRIYGIRHLTSKKEERQNNPEIELNEAQFIALERRKRRIREKSIKEAESKGFCDGEHTLTYGTAPEQREEKALEAEELEEIKDEPKNITLSPKKEEVLESKEPK
jgi:Mor family transcriptional regulator